jgi:hypothetical protein
MDFFKHVESFIKRLELYTKIPPTPGMIKLATEIMVTILSGLVLVNKQIHQGRFSKLIRVLTLPRGIC